MAIVFITANDLDGYSSSVQSTSVFINANVVLGDSTSNGLFLNNVGHDVMVRGSVIGSGFGVQTGPSNTSTSSYGTVVVAAGGFVFGTTGILMTGVRNVISNSGEVFGNFAAIILSGNGGSSTVLNRGLVNGDQYGVWIEATDTQTLTFRNLGTLSGETAAYQGGAGIDKVINRGAIFGQIDLGEGSDRYDGRSGTIEDAVLGNGGNDIFRPGTDDEMFYGGSGNDTLDFRSSTGVRVSLRDTDGTGAAQGDYYSEIEQIFGSMSGADTLIGDDVGNTLCGFAGNDTFVGDVGRDTIFGGAGSDRIQFDSLAERGDIIDDFSNLVDNNDAFLIRAAAFGGGLVAGALAAGQFVTRLADNLALDANDRFIFRRDNTTLWFDYDGTGAVAAVQIADLQFGAPALSAADIILF